MSKLYKARRQTINTVHLQFIAPPVTSSERPNSALHGGKKSRSSIPHNCMILCRPEAHFIELVIHWLLPWQQCFIANQNQECHFICHWMTNCHRWQVLWNGPPDINVYQTVYVHSKRAPWYALLCAMHPHSNDQNVSVARAMCALCLTAMCRHWRETCGKCNGIYWSISTLSGKIGPFHLVRWWRYELWIQRITLVHRGLLQGQMYFTQLKYFENTYMLICVNWNKRVPIDCQNF